MFNIRKLLGLNKHRKSQQTKNPILEKYGIDPSELFNMTIDSVSSQPFTGQLVNYDTQPESVVYIQIKEYTLAQFHEISPHIPQYPGTETKDPPPSDLYFYGEITTQEGNSTDGNFEILNELPDQSLKIKCPIGINIDFVKAGNLIEISRFEHPNFTPEFKEPTSIHDPIIGKLIQSVHDLYETEKSVEIYGIHGSFGCVMMTVKKGQKINTHQQYWFKWLHFTDTSLIEIIQNAIFDYYIQYCQDFYDDITDCYSAEECEAMMPKIHKPNEIWELLSPHYIAISDQSDCRYDVALSFHATWDDEHGVEISLKDKEAVEVGQEGCTT